VFPRRQTGLGVKMATHLYLVLKFRNECEYTSNLPHALMALEEDNFIFALILLLI
jgi:hypothetical protein